MIGSILVDTGPLVAILAPSDEYHRSCVEQLHRIRGPLLICGPVVTEAAWLLRTRPGAVNRLLESIQNDAFHMLPLDKPDLPAISAILDTYKNLKLQFADASLLHLANRDGIRTVFTIDRRSFGVVRLASGERLRIIP